jgi:hypothetical protein
MDILLAYLHLRSILSVVAGAPSDVSVCVVHKVEQVGARLVEDVL